MRLTRWHVIFGALLVLGAVNADSREPTAAPASPAAAPATSTSGGAIVLTSSKAGRPLEIAHPNGVRTVVSYDAVGRVAVMRHSFGAADLAVVSYEYDANGNRTSESIEAQSQTWETTYSYDALDRLIGYASPEESVNYELDPRDPTRKRRSKQVV